MQKRGKLVAWCARAWAGGESPSWHSGEQTVMSKPAVGACSGREGGRDAQWQLDKAAAS